MAVASNPGPLRFSLLGNGLGFRTKPSPSKPGQRSHDASGTDDEWYIPYNGPYESPRQSFPSVQRDSWGEIIEERDDEHIIGDKQLQDRYWHNPSEERPSRSPRTRAVSNVSGRTMSSANVDPARMSSAPRRSTVSQVPHIPSFIDPAATGGIGESPLPRQRTISSGRAGKSSFAQFFFGSNARKSQPNTPSPASSWGTPVKSSSEHMNHKQSAVVEPMPTPRPHLEREKPQNFSDPNEIDYFRAHYPTLPDAVPPVPTKPSFHHVDSTDLLRNALSQHQNPSTTVPITSVVSPSQSKPPPPHPYTYSVAYNSASSPTKPTLPPKPTTAYLDGQFPANTGRPIPQLHASTSTPNLRRSKLPASVKRGKDRWFSAETWCDALFLPRPRFKMSQDSPSTSSGRIVSPPGSPLFPDEKGKYPEQGTGFESRVLAHSRSMADLRLKRGEDGIIQNVPTNFESRGGTLVYRPAPLESDPPANNSTSVQVEPTNVRQPQASGSRPPRPKSFALDDLALPSPIPSLSTVLEEGHRLDKQRREWQTQAAQSFQNSRTRNISRARSKSVGGKRKPPETTVDFLKERSFLGHQGVKPVVIILEPEDRDTSTGRASHSHKNSLSKTVSTKSSRSQGHSTDHSRSDSWGRSALKMAKSTAALCGFNNDATASPLDERNVAILDNALERDEAVRSRPPADASLGRTLSPTSIPRNSLSPTPSSRISDSQVGIAISTPADAVHMYNAEPVRIPAHPFAQAAVHSYAQFDEGFSSDQDHITPSASTHVGLRTLIKHDAGSELSEYAVRHRLPPQASVHPYAAAANDDTKLVAYPRFDSNISPASKMWAQLRPGVVDEILPDEIQYSPSTGTYSSQNDEALQSNRRSDRVSIGEALSYAMNKRISRDSGIGASEEQELSITTNVVDDLSTDDSKSINVLKKPSTRRKPVQYDVLQPIHTRSSIPSHFTIGSSIMNSNSNSPSPAQRPKTDRNDSSGSSRDVTSQASSPPHSPPPFGNYDDLDNFRDIFYRPTSSSADAVSPTSTLRHRQSHLTALARELSQDLEELRATQYTEAQHHRPSGFSGESHGLQNIKDLHFILESDPHSSPESNQTSPARLEGHKIQAFQPSTSLPEDVESSRASSPLEGMSEDDHNFKFGSIEAVSTPPVLASENRFSQRLSFVEENGNLPIHKAEEPQQHQSWFRPQTTSRTSLQPPPTVPFNRSSSSGLTRSSVMTTSTQSRISGLSDFPVPPEHTLTPAHMSILNDFFDDTATATMEQASRTSAEETTVHEPVERSRRFTFGADDSQTLSPSLPPHP